MRIQWTMIAALLFALITAVFAVINVNPVEVNFLFGSAGIPLILVILGSALLGGLMVGLYGIIRQYKLQKQLHALNKEMEHIISETGYVRPVPQPANTNEQAAIKEETHEN